MTAPITGRVGLRLVDPGNVVQATARTPLAVITQFQPITVVFTIPEDNLGQVEAAVAPWQSAAGGRCSTAPTRPKWPSESCRRLDNQIDTTTGTVKLRAIFDNKDDALFPNQFVNTRLLVNTLQGVTLIPPRRHSAQRRHIVRVMSFRTIRRTLSDVKPGVTDAGMTQVTGINPGDVVADSSFEKLQDNAKVVISKDTASGEQEREQRSVSPSRPFILRPVATSLLMAAILLVGIVAYTQLPVSALPEVDYPTIQVLTFYPGASPDVMATTVTAPLERQFGQMQGLSQMTSTSSGATFGHRAAVQSDSEHRRGGRRSAVGHQRGAELPARPTCPRRRSTARPIRRTRRF